jgi:ketosteroid isomerase-like protein
MAHPDEDLARRAYEAFAQGDMQTMDSMIADDVQWHVGGHSVISGHYDGKQAVFGFFQQLAERSGGSFSLEVHDIVANDRHTVALVKARGEHDGRQIDDDGVHVLHIEDGRMTSFWSFAWDEDAQAAFWG